MKIYIGKNDWLKGVSKKKKKKNLNKRYKEGGFTPNTTILVYQVFVLSFGV